jgi:uncharacterized membrane protein YccC
MLKLGGLTPWLVVWFDFLLSVFAVLGWFSLFSPACASLLIIIVLYFVNTHVSHGEFRNLDPGMYFQ